MPRKTSLLLAAVVTAAMATGVNHRYLFGPDEPREAEIPRETLRGGHWIVPRLCGLPFLEKPPLYYDLVALSYAATGRVSPPAARAVSVFFGAAMLTSAFLLARRWRGTPAAWLVLLVLLTMPRFWRYSHVILLDIAVGAFCSCALACFGWGLIGDSGDRRRLLPSLCAFFSACAFLTKGFVAVFTIAVIILAFCAATRRWGALRELLSPLPLLIFLVPVSVWLALFYREGGIPYLYEHFVNNILGRFLHVHFELPDARFFHTDLGHRLPWYFYLEVLPEIMGPWVLFLPFAAWRAVTSLRKSGRGDAQFIGLLLVWAFLPISIFSFSGIKERSYILPSYTAMAMLIGAWLIDTTSPHEEETWRGAAWMGMVFPVAALSLVSPLLSARSVLLIAAVLVLPMAGACAAAAARRRFAAALFPLVALTLCTLIVSTAPSVARVFHRKKCLFDLARETWDIVGDRAIYLYRPSDNIRGYVPFYADRTLRELDRAEELRAVLGGPSTTFVIMEQGNLDALSANPSFRGLLHLIPTPAFGADPDNRLLADREGWQRKRSGDYQGH